MSALPPSATVSIRAGFGFVFVRASYGFFLPCRPFRVGISSQSSRRPPASASASLASASAPDFGEESCVGLGPLPASASGVHARIGPGQTSRLPASASRKLAFLSSLSSGRLKRLHASSLSFFSFLVGAFHSCMECRGASALVPPQEDLASASYAGGTSAPGSASGSFCSGFGSVPCPPLPLSILALPPPRFGVGLLASASASYLRGRKKRGGN